MRSKERNRTGEKDVRVFCTGKMKVFEKKLFENSNVATLGKEYDFLLPVCNVEHYLMCTQTRNAISERKKMYFQFASSLP